MTTEAEASFDFIFDDFDLLVCYTAFAYLLIDWFFFYLKEIFRIDDTHPHAGMKMKMYLRLIAVVVTVALSSKFLFFYLW